VVRFRLIVVLLLIVVGSQSVGTVAYASSLTYGGSRAAYDHADSRADGGGGRINVAKALGPCNSAAVGGLDNVKDSTAASTTRLALVNATNTAHVISGSRPAPGKGDPNSIWEQIRPDGTRSVTYYDQTGEPFSREDYGQQRGHGQMDPSTPHEHQTCFNDLGQPTGKYYRELDANGRPVGPWIKG
jgi:filamentous hemagglutinin